MDKGEMKLREGEERGGLRTRDRKESRAAARFANAKGARFADMGTSARST